MAIYVAVSVCEGVRQLLAKWRTIILDAAFDAACVSGSVSVSASAFCGSTAANGIKNFGTFLNSGVGGLCGVCVCLHPL